MMRDVFGYLGDGGTFARVPHYLISSDAFKDLPHVGKLVLLLFLFRWQWQSQQGERRKAISFGPRETGPWHISESQHKRAMKTLIDRGFLECAQTGRGQKRSKYLPCALWGRPNVDDDFVGPF